MRDPGNEVLKVLRNLFISFSDWFERRGIISAHDAADPTYSTSAVRKNCTEKSRKTAETRKMRFTIELVDKYNYQYELLQLSKTKNTFDIDRIAEKSELPYSSFPVQLSSGLKRVLSTFNGLILQDIFNFSLSCWSLG